jgi:hypothetical protein
MRGVLDREDYPDIIAMASSKEVSMFPDPPPFYRLYETWKEGEDYENAEEGAPLPPPAPVHGLYQSFGRKYFTEPTATSIVQSDVIPEVLDELRTFVLVGIIIISLLGSETIWWSNTCALVASAALVKDLNHSVLLNYMQLLQILQQSPSSYREKVADIRQLFQSMECVLNRYRKQQAFATLNTLLKYVVVFKCSDC